MNDFQFVTSSHPAYIESLYNEYLKTPETVDPEWKMFFEGFDFALNKSGTEPSKTKDSVGKESISKEQFLKEIYVFRLIRSYRKRAHLIATTNPIRDRKDRKPFLALENFNLNDSDFNTHFEAGKFIGLQGATLREILDKVQLVYSGDVGIEYTYITDKPKCNWVERAFEDMQTMQLTIEQKKRILLKLNQGVMFEKFLHTKYIGQKRFSLEGGESAIAALDFILTESAEAGVKEVVIGMAHRGRLNVLANTLGKTYEQIFSEFEGNTPDDTTMGSGDVKYHLGFRANITTASGKEINVQLSPNPSHLEVVAPVVSGFARAKADMLYANEYDRVLPIAIHGDAAIAGQGVVYELLQMSKLDGYRVGGTIHFVINNQIGFTTDFDDARSSDYCTSVAAIVQAPVLHVNGDDPEAVVKAAMLAVKYRQEFNQDIFIDMVCYRRHGHNEGDDPAFTQPLMYDIIKTHPNAREVYNNILINRGDIDAELAKEMEDKYWTSLQDRLDEVKQKPIPYKLQDPEKAWTDMQLADEQNYFARYDTAIPKEEVDALVQKLMETPDDFTPLRKIKKLLDAKAEQYQKDGLIDWATAELMSYASLLKDNKGLRMSGQDVQRGTFSHRHAILHDEKTNLEYNRVDFAADNKGQFHIYNSLLSEFAVLGFEYGYSIASPDVLTIWEAQFGDFANGCQTVIDQYITSAETKWRKMSSLVLLLPHGYEGQGPEHSSGRIERFLQMCAEHNITVTNITMAANFFHAIRRQLAFPFRNPLINFSPKANLRLDRTYSPAAEFSSGGFKEVIDDAFVKTPSKVKRVLLCSGKVYFDLSDKQMKDDRQDAAVVRLEQIFPIPILQLEELRKKYKKAEWIWVQEEPRNMGAFSFLKVNLEDFPMRYITRPTSASPATGFSKKHKQEQTKLVEEAFA